MEAEAYLRLTDGTKQLWLHSLYSELDQPMPGTEGASTPFWSTDSQWIGFFGGNSLKTEAGQS
jgi:hypothetical protein